MRALIIAIMALFLTACVRYVYVPINDKGRPIEVVPDKPRPVMKVSHLNSQDEKIAAIIQSYSLCESRVKYLDNICRIQ